MRDANEAVGVWSVYGVEEARALFWRSIEGGKNFAKRQSMWDMFFSFTMGRDENLTAFLLRAVLTLLFNLTLGLVFSLVAFAWHLWSLLVAYKVSLVRGEGCCRGRWARARAGLASRPTYCLGRVFSVIFAFLCCFVIALSVLSGAWQLQGLLFFVVAMVGAASMVLLYVLIMFGTVAGGAYALYTVAMRQALQNGPRAQYGPLPRPHRD